MEQPQKYTDQLNTVFYASIGLPMLFFGWVYLPRQDTLSWQSTGNLEVPIWMTYLLGMVLMAAAVWVVVGTTKKLKTISEQEEFHTKFTHFAAHWKGVYWATGFISLLAVGLLLVFEHTFFVVTYGLLLFFISLYRPSPTRLKRDMNWTKEQSKVFDQYRKVLKNLREHQE